MLNFESEHSSELVSMQSSYLEEIDTAIIKPNLSILEEKDPSLLNGFKIIFNKEIPIEIKLQTKNGEKNLASFEPIRCKLLIDNINENKKPNHIKIELSCENDIYFHFTKIIDEKEFLDIKKKQNLNITFSQFSELFEKICENCRASPNEYICFFLINRKSNSVLKFLKNSDFKFLELLLLEFERSSEEVINKQIIYRFTILKSKLDYEKKCIKKVGDIIVGKNPDILQPILENNDKYNLNVYKYFGKSLLGK